MFELYYWDRKGRANHPAYVFDNENDAWAFVMKWLDEETNNQNGFDIYDTTNKEWILDVYNP